MTKKVELFGRHVIITGFRDAQIGDVEVFLREVQQKIKKSEVQFLDANLVAGWEHLYFSTLNALRAFDTGLNISKSSTIEVLLYASGQHQIRRAFEMLGVKSGASDIALLIISKTETDAEEALKTVSNLLKGNICDEVLELTEKKAEAIKGLFNISNLEVEAATRAEDPKRSLINLVIERVALLATRH